MMSFFLLLWLLNVTTSDQRKGLAEYFSPAGISKNESSGAGGIFGGRSISSETGGEISYRSPPSTQEATIPTVGQGEEGEEDTAGKSKNKAKTKEERNADALSKAAAVIAEATKDEETAFKQAEQALKQAILQTPELQAFSDQIVIDRTSEGLRIQITDRDKLSLFPSASAIPYERGRDLLLMIGKVVSLLPNKISIAGHTDAAQFIVGSRRDNWTLSTERANTSREYLIKAGVDEKNIARVSGLADREPFSAEAMDPRNRRISIVLLRRSLTQIPGAPAQLQTPAPAETKTP